LARNHLREPRRDDIIPLKSQIVTPEDLADGWVVLNPEQARGTRAFVPPWATKVRSWLAGGSAHDKAAE
jgi:hypothetical protein